MDRVAGKALRRVQKRRERVNGITRFQGAGLRCIVLDGQRHFGYVST